MAGASSSPAAETSYRFGRDFRTTNDYSVKFDLHNSQRSPVLFKI
jgi:hypothetical protein